MVKTTEYQFAATKQSTEKGSLNTSGGRSENQEIKKTRFKFSRPELPSKQPRQVWNVIHIILKPKSSKINAGPQTLTTF